MTRWVEFIPIGNYKIFDGTSNMQGEIYPYKTVYVYLDHLVVPAMYVPPFLFICDTLEVIDPILERAMDPLILFFWDSARH